MFYCLSRSALLISMVAWLMPIEVAAQNAAPWVGSSLAGIRCQGGGQGYGPFDYLQRSAYPKELNLVEGAHFTADVENLVRGNAGSLQGDLDYTLRAWPNHHRALNSMMRYQRSLGKDPSSLSAQASVPSIECYLQRAIAFSPEDATTKMLMAMHLHYKRFYSRAKETYETAMQAAPNDLQIKYNYALLLVDMKEYVRARQLAKEIYDQEFPLLGLQRKLDRLRGE